MTHSFYPSAMVYLILSVMQASTRRLDGQVAVITGATSGIGRAIALCLAEAGAEVVGVGRNSTALASLRGRDGSPGLTILPRLVDLTDEMALQDFASGFANLYDGIDFLVHGAGVFARGTVESAPLEDLDRQMQLNVRAPYLLTQLLLPSLRRRRGHVVFLNSSAALRPHAGVSQYSAGKAALRAIADALREEVNAQGIRVTTVFAGRTATPMQEQVRRLEGLEYRPHDLLQPDDIAQLLLGILLLPDSAEVTEVVVRPMRKA